MRKLIYCCHADFSNAEAFARLSNLDEVADMFGAEIIFAKGRRYPAWYDDYEKKSIEVFGKPIQLQDYNEDAFEFDRVARSYDRIVVAGYSRGANFGHFLLNTRHPDVNALVSYGGVNRPEIYGMGRAPVLSMFNQWDMRQYMPKVKRVLQTYKGQGRYVDEFKIRNRMNHFGRWDADANERMIAFLHTTGVFA